MLKTKLTYMALGAVIASIGYFIGTFNHLNAQDEVAHVKKLIVSEEILIENDKGVITITPVAINLKRNKREGSINIGAGVDTTKTAKVVKETPHRSGAKTYWESLDAEALVDKMIFFPAITMRKPNGKVIALTINEKSQIKLSNGGLKSKTIAVD